MKIIIKINYLNYANLKIIFLNENKIYVEKILYAIYHRQGNVNIYHKFFNIAKKIIIYNYLIHMKLL